MILLICAGFALLRLLLACMVVAILFAVGGCAVSGSKPDAPADPHYLDDMLARRAGVPHEF